MGAKEALSESQRAGLRKVGAGLWADVHTTTCNALKRRGLAEDVLHANGVRTDLLLTDRGRDALAKLEAVS